MKNQEELSEENESNNKEEMAKPKKLKKPKSSITSEKPLSPEELEELRQTESEVAIDKKSFICVVHKGSIDGELYLCPHCHTFYCEKCAKALKLKNEKCWSCDRKITITISLIGDSEITSVKDITSALEDVLSQELSEKDLKRVQELKEKINKAEHLLQKSKYKEAAKKYESALIIALKSGNDAIARALTAITAKIRKLIPEEDETKQKEKKKKADIKVTKEVLKATVKLTKQIQKKRDKKG